jgi:O-methyltransferase
MMQTLKLAAQERFPSVYQFLYSCKETVISAAEDVAVWCRFLLSRSFTLAIRDRLNIIFKAYLTSKIVPTVHREAEVFSFVSEVLALPATVKGIIVEAGCYKGSSTAKFSWAAHYSGRKLVIFDSFQGIPETSEEGFHKGDYCGELHEVRSTVSRFGKLEACCFIPGWFEDTMPQFHEPIAAIYVDVDLVSSTRTCLKYLYPLIHPDGVFYSQDGHIERVIELYKDQNFWRNEIGSKPPLIKMIYPPKLVACRRDLRSNYFSPRK